MHLSKTISRQYAAGRLAATCIVAALINLLFLSIVYKVDNLVDQSIIEKLKNSWYVLLVRPVSTLGNPLVRTEN